MVYARPEHGTTLVANIKEIIRIPKEPVEPLGKKRGARRAQTRSKSTAAPDDESEWDSMTVREHAVFDYVTGESVVRGEFFAFNQSLILRLTYSPKKLRLLLACSTRNSLATTNGCSKRFSVREITWRLAS